MALIKIEGVELPTPSEYNFSVMDVSDAKRNANAFMLIERISTKVKISLSWSYLNAIDLKNVLAAIQPVFYDVTYFDPRTNSMQTGSFYAGDRSVDMIDFQNGVPRFKEINFNLIER